MVDIDWSKIRPVRQYMTVRQMVHKLNREQLMVIANHMHLYPKNILQARTMIVSHCKMYKLNVWDLGKVFQCVYDQLPLSNLD